jgi:predicted dehydrogenase
MFGVGIVGPGWAAGEHLKAFANNPHTTVKAVCGRDETRARRKMAESNVDCDYAAQFSDLVARDDIHIISICTPHNQHVELAVEAARAGKHLVLEKPIALHPEELRQLRDVINETGVKTITCFELRWNPYYKMVRNLLQTDAIGSVFYAEVDYFHGIGPWYGQYLWNVKKEIAGSSLLTAGCHALDALVSLVDSSVTEVTAYSAFGKADVFAEYEYDPTLVALLKFANGAIGKVASCVECRMPYTFPVFLTGTKGSIRDNRLWSHQLEGQTDWATIPTIMPDSGDVTHHPYQEEFDYFVDCIRNKQDNILNIEESATIHEIIFAADESAASGQPVKL